MPTVAAGGGHILNIDFFCCKFVKEAGKKGGARKHPSDDEEEEQGEQGGETIPKQGKAGSVAEALADAIPSAGKESGKASADSAKPQSDCALNAVIK